MAPDVPDEWLNPREACTYFVRFVDESDPNVWAESSELLRFHTESLTDSLFSSLLLSTTIACFDFQQRNESTTTLFQKMNEEMGMALPSITRIVR
jgi:hypothetical protein